MKDFVANVHRLTISKSRARRRRVLDVALKRHEAVALARRVGLRLKLPRQLRTKLHLQGDKRRGTRLAKSVSTGLLRTDALKRTGRVSIRKAPRKEREVAAAVGRKTRIQIGRGHLVLVGLEKLFHRRPLESRRWNTGNKGHRRIRVRKANDTGRRNGCRRKVLRKPRCWIEGIRFHESSYRRLLLKRD